MQYKILILQKFIITFLIFVLCFMGLTFFVNINRSMASPISEPTVNIKEVIPNIKNKYRNLELVYESDNINGLHILVYLENNKYKSIIIDSYGREITFYDLIKENKLENYTRKEKYLLNLKYPEFIVDTLINTSGTKVYFLKDNEVTIYYYDYTYPYNYDEEVSVTINYNEIKDFIKFNPVLDKKYVNEDGYNYKKELKSVAITFDDGPSRMYNSKILEELKKNKAHATFFMVGSVMNTCMKCVLDTYNSGNEIGSHTYDHINMKTKKKNTVLNSLEKVDTLYNKITKDNILLIRPPYGAYDKENLNTVKKPLILWNLDTEDWRYRDAIRIKEYILDNVSDGSIILMHELYETSYEALKEVLPELYAKGYQVVSISELAKLKNKPLEAGKAYYHFKSK